MNKADQINALTSLASRLKSLVPKNDEEIALVGFCVGAIYSLSEATRISDSGYSDEHLEADYPKVLMNEIETLSEGKVISDSIWLSGYYFNSGLYRISALNERIDKYIGQQSDLARGVRREVNRFKHDVEGVLGGRTVGMDDALNGLEKLVLSLEAFMKT
jgi:hypothetical protein